MWAVSRRVAWERRPQAAALLEQAQGRGSPVRRGSGRGVRAGVHRSPVRAGRPASAAARHAGVVARGGWPGRPRRPDASGVDAGAGRAVAAGGGAVPSSDDGGDDGTDDRAGPVPGRPPAVRVPAGGRGSTSEPGARRRGDGAVIGWPRTRSRRRTCGGCSPSACAGRSVAGIARELNERGVPCPSAADPERNRHRGGQGWNLRSVAVILANPRYTGRQVWSRQRSVPGAGRSTVAGEWAVSRTRVPSRAGQRSRLHRGAAVSCSAEVCGRSDARLRARRAGAVPGVRSADGLALGQRSRRIPVPSRSPAAPGPDRRTRRATSTSARTCSWTGSRGTSRPIGTDPAATSSRAPSKKSSPGCGPSRR